MAKRKQSDEGPDGPERSGSDAKLRVSNVSKSFPLADGERIDAVVDASFDVADNELCILLGPSGCGKSTLLRMVAGLEEPTEGTLVLDGHEILGPGGDRGMVFQSYTSFDWLTVQENVEYGMRLNGVPKAERREQRTTSSTWCSSPGSGPPIPHSFPAA